MQTGIQVRTRFEENGGCAVRITLEGENTLVGNGDNSTTSLTLLGRLRCFPADQQAWGVFVERYGPRLYAWARQRGLQDADAQDVAQNVLVDLAKQLRKFEYRPGGSFRAWLRTIVYRAWCDLVSSRQLAPASLEEHGLATQAASDELVRYLEDAWDRELLEEAQARVRLRVQPHTWEAFRLLAVEGASGQAVAEQLGMQLGAVYVARSKVQKMLQEEVRRLERASDQLAE